MSVNTTSVYRERAYLVAFLTTLYPSVGSYNDPDEPDYMVVYVETPVGQMSWYIHSSDTDLFEGICIVDSHTWDGHTTEDKYQRLHNFTQTRRMSATVLSGSSTPGRVRLEGLLAGYDYKLVAASLRG
jgi:hypothetical protein